MLSGFIKCKYVFKNLLFIFFVYLSCYSLADNSDSCNDIFGDAAGTTGVGGSINLGTNATFFNSPDNLIYANSITTGGGNTRPTCDSIDCSTTSSTLPAMTLPAFQYQSGGASTYKNYGEDYTIDGSVVDHDTISAGGNAVITFDAPTGGVYRINQLTINYNSTINLAPGDYYINNYAINGLVTINITGSGTVRLFVNNSFTIGETNTINTPTPGTGDPGRLIVIGYNNITINASTVITGYVYAAGDFTLFAPTGGPSAVYGSVSAQNITLNSYAEIHYEDPLTAATTPTFSSICALAGNDLIATFTFDALNSGVYDDSSTNSYTATPDASTSINSSGKVCSAVEIPYDNSTSFVGVETDIDFAEIDEAGSFSAWVNLNSDWNAFSDRRTLLFAKQSNRFIDITINKQGRVKFEIKDSSNNTLSANSNITGFTSGQWHHIVVTWDLSSTIDVDFYIDGSLDASLVADASDPWADYSGLSAYDTIYLFDRRAGVSLKKYALDGLADEIHLYNYEISTTQVNDLFTASRNPCPVTTPVLDHFEYSYSTTGSTCPGFPSAVTIRAMDATNAVITGYTGDIDLTTSSNHGTWSINDADGTLTDATNDDGIASYLFDATDLGEIVLNLENTHADDQLITTTDAAESISTTSSSTINFSDNTFLVEPDSVQIAGKPLDVTVTLILTDASSNQCGVATDFNEERIKAWYEPFAPTLNADEPRLNNAKLKSTEPNSSNERFDFVNGIANIEITSSDIGSFVFHVFDDLTGYAKDTGATPINISGQSQTITLKPFALAMDFDNDSNSANSAASNAFGSVFKKVDENFTLTVTPVLWDSADDLDNDGVPDSGADFTDNDEIPSFDDTDEIVLITATHALPSGGVTGSLSGITASDNFFSDNHDYTLSYSEVGIISLSAEITNSGFLNSGDDAKTTITNVGRFIPDHFSISSNTPNLQDALNACSITYQGQNATLDTDLVFTLNALDSSGDPVLNYVGDFNKFDETSLYPTLNRTIASSGYGADPTVVWQAPVLSDETNFDGDWVVTVSPSSITYDKTNNAPTASDLPYLAELNANIASGLLTDSDGICVDSGSGCEGFSSSAIDGATIVYGAAFLRNTYQSDLQNAVVPVDLKIWAMQNSLNDFYNITADSCSALLISDYEFLSCDEQNGSWCNANYSGNLAAPHTWTGFTNAQGELTISTPGENNTGKLSIRLNLPSYLQFDYYGSGVTSPIATIDFGINNQNSPLIFIEQDYR